MLMLVWITLFDSLSSSHNFVDVLRIPVLPGVPMGLNELTAVGSFLAAIFWGGTLQMQYPRLRSHPLIAWLIGLWVIGWLAGAVGAIGTLAEGKEVMTMMREYASAPVFIFVGYRLLSDPKSMRWMVNLMVIAGIGNATQLLLRFGRGAQELISTSDNLNPIREVEFFTSYAAITFVLMLFSIFSQLRIVRPWLAAVIAAYCCLGVFSSMSRTSAVCMAFGVIAIMIFIVPEGKRLRSAINCVLVSPVLIAALWIGLIIAGILTQRDFFKVAQQQADTLNPFTENVGNDQKVHKAWDTRIPSIKAELGIFARNPLVGGGFAASSDYIAHGNINWGAFGHNTLTGILSNTGIFGITAMLLTLAVPIVLGYRLVHDNIDRSSVLMGALGFIVGLNMLTLCVCTMAFSIRGAMIYGLFAGMMVRAREIQETTRALAHAEEDSLPPIHPHDDGYPAAEPDFVF